MRKILLLALSVAVSTGALTGCKAGGDNPPEKSSAKKEKRAHLVEVATADLRRLGYETTRAGTLNARRMVRIHNQEEGRIEAVAVYEGDQVKADELLVRLDNGILQAEVAKAEANRRQAQSDIKRIQGLTKRKLASEDEFARAQTALAVAEAEAKLLRTRLAYTRIKAPFAGLVTERRVEPGDVTAQHTHLLTIIDRNSLYTEVAVSELLLPLLAVGDTVQVRIDALPGRSLAGRIARIHPTVDAATRQGIIEVDLTDIPDAASPGQLCRVTLQARETERLMVPFAALRRDAEGEYVYVVGDDKRVTRRGVQTGLRMERLVEVVSGLRTSERVVIKGFLGLSEGMNVRLPDAGAEA